jgi:hypothetical protein
MISQNDDRAAAQLAEALRLVSDDRYSSMASLSGYYGWGTQVRRLAEATFFCWTAESRHAGGMSTRFCSEPPFGRRPVRSGFEPLRSYGEC